MARELCQEIIGNIIGKPISEAEIARLEKQVAKRARDLREATPSLTENEAVTQAAESIAAQHLVAINAKKRAALLNEGKRLQAVGAISANWGDQLGLGVRSLVTGTQRNVRGARVSAAGQQDVVRAQLLGGFHASMAKLGPEDLRLFLSDAVEDDIARALWQFSQDAPDAAALKKLNPAAVRIAEVINQYQELARGMANKEGASIGKYAGYIMRSSHDIVSIAKSEAEWKATANATFDLPRMLSEMDYANSDEMIDALYQALSSGLHLKASEGQVTGGKRGLGSLGNRLSKARVIHYKDADAFMAYNQRFGAGNLREAVVSGLDRSANAIGLMQVMGTNPAAFIDSLETQLAKTLKGKNPDAKTVTRFREDIEDARKRLREVDGTMDIPGNSTIAQWSASFRMLQTMASLGGSLLSSVSDLGTFIVSARHNGINPFQAAGAAVGGLLKGRSRPEQVELASALGVVFESMAGKMASRFSLDDGVRGGISAAQQAFFKLNGQTWWTDSLRFAAAEMLSHNLASHAGKSFDALPPMLAKTLGLYGLDAKGWDVARAAVADANGRSFISPDGIKDAGVAKALRAYFTDQNGYLLLSPDAETRYLTKLGTQKGTAAGELVRFMAQFKSFTIAFSQRLAGRELISHINPNVRGAGVWREAAMSGQALLGMANLIAMSTLFGYLAMSMKDIVKGKEPRDPTDVKTALAAMQQGGGLGIMGDFLFGQQNRMGGGFIGTLAGPAAGDLENVAQIFFSAREAALDPEKEAKLGDDLWRLTYSNLPGNNLFYVKPILDYLVLWNFQEMLNPGAMQRMEKRAQDQGQEFFISPSQRVAEQQRAP